MLGWSILQLAAQDTPVGYGTIDLRQPANLKMIFDGGLRPWRLQGLEKSCCVVEESYITVILPNAAPFTIHVRGADFHVLAGNELSTIDLFGVNTSLPEAVAITKIVCNAWGVSTKGLDESAYQIEHGPQFGDHGWGQTFDQPKIRSQVMFNPLYYFKSVGAYVNLGFDLGDHFNGMKFLTNSIQPPSGYENVAMDPPPRKLYYPSVPSVSDEQVRVLFAKKLMEVILKNPISFLKDMIAHPSASPTPTASKPLTQSEQ